MFYVQCLKIEFYIKAVMYFGWDFAAAKFYMIVMLIHVLDGFEAVYRVAEIFYESSEPMIFA